MNITINTIKNGLINLIKMEKYVQQFKRTSLVKRGSIRIDFSFALIKYTNLQNIKQNYFMSITTKRLINYELTHLTFFHLKLHPSYLRPRSYPYWNLQGFSTHVQALHRNIILGWKGLPGTQASLNKYLQICKIEPRIL